MVNKDRTYIEKFTLKPSQTGELLISIHAFIKNAPSTFATSSSEFLILTLNSNHYSVYSSLGDNDKSLVTKSGDPEKKYYSSIG